MYSLTHFPWLCDHDRMAVSTWSSTRAAPTTERSDDLAIEPSGLLRAGRGSTTFVPGDDRSFLVAYLKLVRGLRHRKSDPAITLRRTEIELLADHLRADPADILERLGALMGASITQRRVLAASFAAGAAVIFVAVGASAALSGGGMSSPTTFAITTPDAAPATTIVDESTELHDALPLVVIATAPAGDDADVVPASILAEPASAAPAEPTADPAVPTADPAAAPAAIAPTAPVDDTADASTTVPAPDEVAVGEPPVPTRPYEVAVGEPPVPTPPDG
jgi:hypothetical protein